MASTASRSRKSWRFACYLYRWVSFPYKQSLVLLISQPIKLCQASIQSFLSALLEYQIDLRVLHFQLAEDVEGLPLHALSELLNGAFPAYLRVHPEDGPRLRQGDQVVTTMASLNCFVEQMLQVTQLLN